MILLQQQIEMLEDEPLHRSDGVWFDAAAAHQADGIEPKLALAVARADMNVRRFGSLVGIKVEPESADAKDHGPSSRVRSWW